MSEPRLRRRVEEAVVSAAGVAAHGRAIEQMIPKRAAGEQERLRASVAAASESLKRVAAQGARVNSYLESRFRSASLGHGSPGTVFRTLAEARRHSLREEEDVRRQIMQRHPDARPERIEPGDYAGPADPRLAPPGSAERLSLDIAGWLGRGVLGDALAGRFSRSPPVVTTDPERYFRLEGALSGSGGLSAAGIYHTGTNHISMNSGHMPDLGEAARRETIAHEMFHYASYLGGGGTIRWRDDGGRPILPSGMSFLHEGCTELMAQHVTRAHGFDPGSVAYGAETTLAFYLQQIAGANVLGAAYLGGDFTAVRRAVDAKLGRGAFDSVMASGTGAAALVALRERMERRGLGAELASWDKNPIVKASGAVD